MMGMISRKKVIQEIHTLEKRLINHQAMVNQHKCHLFALFHKHQVLITVFGACFFITGWKISKPHLTRRMFEKFKKSLLLSTMFMVKKNHLLGDFF